MSQDRVTRITMEITEDEFISPHEGWASESPNYGTDWIYVGVQAVAEIIVNGVINRISSAGLWGIESESSEDYFLQVADEQLKELSEILAVLGFQLRDLPDWQWLDRTNWVNPEKLIVPAIVTVAMTEEDVDGIAQRVGIDDLAPEYARQILREHGIAIHAAMHQAGIDVICGIFEKELGR